VPPAVAYFSWHFEDLYRIPSEGPAILACNHISYLDPIANAYAVVRAGRRPRFLAKQELFEIPVIGRVIAGAKQIPVRRGAGERAPLELAERAVRAGEVVVIYPEGTVTTRADGLPMEGKTGAVRLSLATGVAITPMASWGSAAVWQKTGPGSLTPRRPVWVGVGAPIEPAADVDPRDFEAVKRSTAELMRAIGEIAIDLRARYPARWAAGR
jgi:1-acyl-sn-glycerol-3-phosphate acyltransferase